MLVDTLSEEMRILYVALTRSKEKLIITGVKKEYEKQKEKILQQKERYQKQNGKINPILVKKYHKYLDWILLVYFYEEEKMDKIVKLKTYTKQDVLAICEKMEQEDKNIIEKMEEYEVSKEQIQNIQNLLDQPYSFDLSTKIPTKTSVTKIKQEAQEEVVKVSFPVPKFTRKEEDVQLTPAQKGTLLHLCMQKLDENQDYDLEKIKQLINNLIQKEMISLKEAKNINERAILKFTQSKIWQEIRQAKEVHKEKPFYINLGAKEIYQEEVEESVLVQGIIDLYYIRKNDDLILVDYKTDFVTTPQALINKYQKQLELYKRALEDALGKKVKTTWIYSTFLGKEIEVKFKS